MGMQTIVLLGHSTGCQDSVRYMQRYSTETPRMAGVILQASVGFQAGEISTTHHESLLAWTGPASPPSTPYLE